MIQSARERPYLFYRICCLAAFAVSSDLGIVVRADDIPPGWVEVPLLLLTLPAIWMVFSLLAFRWDYSVFGKEPRTAAPFGGPISDSVSGGIVGWLVASWPFFTWSVYQAGVGLSIWGCGDAFLPVSSIARFQRRTWRGCTIWHGSPEVRSPIVIRSNRVATDLERLLSSRTNDGSSSGHSLQRSHFARR